MTEAEPLSRGRLLGYAIGSVGTGIFSALPGLLLLYYLTDVLGVSAAVAGVLLVLPKAWDVLLNPVVGAASDREAVRTGRRTRLLLIGAVTLPLLFTAMFVVPGSSPGLAACWVGVAFLLAASAFACFQVPYVALPAEISPRADQRARAMAWRIVALTIGILVAGGVAPVLVEAAGGGRAGYALMGTVVGLILGGALVTAVLSTRWISSSAGPRPLGLIAALRTARGNRPFFVLLTAAVLQTLAIAVMLTGAPYAATYLLGDYGLTSLMFVCLVGLSVLAVPMWHRLARRYGTVSCYAVAVALFAVTTVALYPALEAAATGPVLVLCAVMGLCYAAMQLLSFQLLPESVRADSSRTGHAQSGAFTGVWMAAETGALALGPGVFAAVLALGSYRAADFEHPVVQPDSALTALTTGFTLLPAVLLAISIPPLLAYRRMAARQYAPAPA